MAAIRALDLFADLTDEWDFVAAGTQISAADLFFFVVEIRHASIMARGCSRVSRAGGGVPVSADGQRNSDFLLVSTVMLSPNDLTLDERAQRCLSLAYLRMMNVDIAASPKKEHPSKHSDRSAFVDVLGQMLPPDCRQYSSALIGQFAGLLRESCGQVKTTTNVAMIISELAVVHPWTGTKMFSQIRVHDESRLIVLKEMASYLQIPDGDRHVDYILEDIVPGPRNVKKIALITLATMAGGLIAAPHIGTAIGVYALGLSGAAATSAGLATLGFGATAAGGFGMAGGTLIVGALTGALGGATSIATTTSKMRSSAMAEALKLHITLYLMFQLPGTASLAREIVSHLNTEIRRVEDLLRIERASTSKSRQRVKELEAEAKVLRSSIPDIPT